MLSDHFVEVIVVKNEDGFLNLDLSLGDDHVGHEGKGAQGNSRFPEDILHFSIR
jgi:hypothetical protein